MHLEFSIVRRDARDAKKYTIDRPEIVFGRAPGCDVILSHDFVSGRHAKLTVSAGRRYTLTDLGSRNGTFLNGAPISGPTRVEEGAVLTFGNDGPQMKIWALSDEMPSQQPQKYTGGPPVPGTMGFSQTRALVIDLQQSNRKWRMVALAGTCLLGTAILGLIVILINRITTNADEARRQIAASEVESKREISVNRGIDAEGIAEKYGSAVFHVRSPVPPSMYFGTAFAIDESGLFATNAHVTELIKKSQSANQQPTVIAQGGLRSYPIKLNFVQSHPHYDPRDEINTQLDVGWFRVEVPPGEKLSCAILANEDELRQIKVGNQCCYIGFPMYNSDDYSKLAQVVPRVYVGNIDRLMNPRRQQGGFSEAYVIEHTMYAWHGASGSPIFNKAGHVIALLNAGDPVKKSVVILPSAESRALARQRGTEGPQPEEREILEQEVAGVTFGIRVDKLIEALNSH
jgi:hypothetical protein